MNITDLSVDQFINSINDIKKQQDSITLVKIMQDVTQKTPKMWGTSIIGFGEYHYKYESGREGDSLIVGFAPRKQELVLYGVTFYNQDTDLTETLGKCKTGKGCLYIKHLSDVNVDVLKEMIKRAYHQKRALH